MFFTGCPSVSFNPTKRSYISNILLHMSTECSPPLSKQHQTHEQVLHMGVADERQLILAAREGNHDAFRQLVERYMKQAYNIAHGFLRNHEHAEDVAQEAFVRVYHALPSFRGDAEFSTWLYRIVTNMALNRVKKEKAYGARFAFSQEREHNTPYAAQQETPENGELRTHIEKALHELPTLQRAVVLLRHIEGLSTKQVSGILACSEGTVKTHLFRGLKKMRTRLEYFRTEMAL